MKSTKLYSKMLLLKSSENNFVFSPAFYLIMCFMKAPNNFGKKSHFENMKAGFLRRCQNSLRQTSPKIMYFQT